MKKNAFLILVHNDAKQLKRLITTLDYNSDFYIHIDAKANINDFLAVIDLPNVHFLEKRISVAWAGISMVDALLLLITEMLSKNIEYSHAIFLTGSCYPIKNKEVIYNHFVSQPSREFVKLVDMREDPNHYMRLINKKWFKEPFYMGRFKALKYLDKGVRTILNKLNLKNKWDNSIIPYYGHTWCALTLDCCRYIQDFEKNNPAFRKMNEFTMAADEHYFHTIIGNSKFKEKSLGVVPYEGMGLYKYVICHLIHPSLQKWYSIDDWDEIKLSGQLFLRKVNSEVSSSLLDKIDLEYHQN